VLSESGLAIVCAVIGCIAGLCPVRVSAQDSTASRESSVLRDSSPSRDSTVARDSALPVTVSSEPQPLVEGTAAWLLVRADSGSKVRTAEAGGEPIHFEHTPEGGYRGIVGVPVEVGDSIRISVVFSRGHATDSTVVWLPVAQGGYPRESLSVAPGYVKPDSVAAARIQVEIARSREVSRLSQLRPRLWREPFLLPRPSRITSRFGAARVFNGEVQTRHLGTDFAGAIGAPVRAAGRGVVALVAEFYLAGRAIYLDHGGGLVTAYFHLSRAYVSKGDTVSGGQQIGAVGRTGRVTGPHLHWVARYGKISVDPMSLLQLQKSER
jgi:murein DD-endopeptidase MepM/ murein hydrolase activator NlpD